MPNAPSPAIGATVRYDATTGLYPDQACSPWQYVSDGSAAPTLYSDALEITTSRTRQPSYYIQRTTTLQEPNNPPLSFPDPFVIETRMRLLTGASTDASRGPAGLGFTTSTDLGNTLYWDNGKMFLLKGANESSPPALVDTSSFHTYRIEVTQDGNITVSYDGSPVLAGSEVTQDGNAPEIYWGNPSILAYGQSQWAYVSHNASTMPCPVTNPFVPAPQPQPDLPDHCLGAPTFLFPDCRQPPTPPPLPPAPPKPPKTTKDKAQDWAHRSGALADLFLVCDLVAAGALAPIATVVVAAPVGVACTGGGALSFISAGIATWVARDPPDPRYKTISPPVRLRQRAIKTSRLVPSRAARVLTDLQRRSARTASLGAAMMHAVERSQGAYQANDREWVRRQTSAASRDASLYADAMTKEASSRTRAQRILPTTRLGRAKITARAVKAAQRQLRKHGLRRSTQRLLKRLGVPALVQSQLVKDMTRSPASPPRTVASIVSGSRSTAVLRTFAKAVRSYATALRRYGAHP